MESGKSRADVAVFVDFENVYVSVREKFDAQPNFELIMDRCEDFGRIVIARAYADWYRYPRVTSALFANGVEPMYVPTYYYDREVGRTGRPIKNSVDIHLCIDAMRTLYTQTHIDKFVLVTGDRDFIPLVNAIRQHGKEVIIIGIGGAASAHLAQSSDEFLFYEQIADIKPPQAREQAGRGERRERKEGAESNGRRERRERPQTPAPEQDAVATPEPAAEAAAAEAGTAERSPYDTLVDAINLARQRGFVSNLGSLKVLMRELDSDFNESKVRDANGKAFQKFKDFVKEAERQGRVQIFTNGTVTEVFLPGEDPMNVSQFADELAEQAAERELENELDREAQRNEAVEGEAEVAAEADGAAALADRPERTTERRSRRRGRRDESRSVEFPTPVESEAGEGEAIEAGEAEGVFEPLEVFAEADAAETAPDELSALPDLPEAVAELETAADPATPAPVFGEREWEIFRNSMAQFEEPVRFADVFSAMRGLRNQEVLALTNNELKELIKQAINRNMLQRTGRGARAYYRLAAPYRSASAEPVLDTSTDTAVGLVDAEGRASELAPESETQPVESEVQPAVEAEAPAEAVALETVAEVPVVAPELGPQVTLSEVVGEQVALQTAEAPAPRARRNRRKKKTDEDETSTEEAAAAPAEAAEAAAAAPADEGAAAPAEAPKKRRTRRKPKAEAEPTQE